MDFEITNDGQPQRRKDPLTGRWVTLIPSNPSELIDFFKRCRQRFTCHSQPEDYVKWCYCCPGHAQLTNHDIVQKNTSHGTIRVTTEKNLDFIVTDGIGRRGDGLYDCMNRYGVDETVIIGEKHGLKISELPTELLAESFKICQERIQDLNRNRNLINIIFWANGNHPIDGKGFAHPQWHITSAATPYQRIVEEMTCCFEYYYIWDKQRCLICDIIREEKAKGIRIIAITDHFIVFEPHGSRYPFETWLIPLQHSHCFEQFGKEDRNLSRYWLELSELIKKITSKLEALLGNHLPFSILLYNPPRRFHYRSPHNSAVLTPDQIASSFHWRLRLVPNLSLKSRYENSTGESINSLLPKQAALILKLPLSKIQQLI